MPSHWQETPSHAKVELGSFDFHGRTFTALGAIVDHAAGRVVGYPTVDTGAGRLHAWDGSDLGSVRVVGRASGLPDITGRPIKLICYRATVDGRQYHGRGLGRGMVLKLRACKAKEAAR